MKVLPAGDRALLIECDSLAAVLHAHRVLTAHPIDGVRELVPAARTVLVRLDPRAVGLGHVEHRVRELLAVVDAGVGESDAVSRTVVSIPVLYDGEDLEVVATAWGCDVEEVVRRHGAIEWECAFLGFAPGFPYLVPVDSTVPEGDVPPRSSGAEAKRLPPVPRRATSRPRVPAGAVALAAEYCGVYPRTSPGGWQLIGRTDAPLWDARRDPPALVTAGTRVRFVLVSRTNIVTNSSTTTGTGNGTSTGTGTGTGNGTSTSTSTSTGNDTAVSPLERALTPEKVHAKGRNIASTGALVPEVPELVHASRVHVVEPGALTLVQDLGRPGLGALGVSGSGAFDRAAHRLANRLVGNNEGAAGLEVLLGGLTLALPAGTWFAVTGAEGPVTLDGAPVPTRHAARANRDGALLSISAAEHGLRFSVAVRGGLDIEPLLGSRSRDTLAALGPEPLSADTLLPLGTAVAGPIPAVDLIPVDAPPDGPTELPVRPGPRRDWFTDAAWDRMLETEWTVSPRSDRTGVRLQGPALEREHDAVGRELPSEGMLPGSIQVSPDGAPTVLGPDHPVTGGYPVIAVVTDEGLDRLAQLRPGQTVRLHLVAGRY